MDILTQALLGGVLAQSVAHKNEKKLAAITGMVAGLIADADVLIGSASDPLLQIEFHRHFTHALVFIPFGAAIALLLLWPFMRNKLPLSRLYLFCFAGFSLSGVLDGFTSYGTHLFWPFTDVRTSLNLIAIVDPIFTLILLTALVLGLRKFHRSIAMVGLLLAAGYLGVGFVQQQRAETLAVELAASRGHELERHLVKPTIANQVLWRSVYVHDQKIYVDAIRVGYFGGSKIYTGEMVPRFSVAKDYPHLDPTTVMYQDIQRFIRFSDDWVAFDQSSKHVLGDIRYSLLPTSVRPLWGIVLDPDNPQHHAGYQFFRKTNTIHRQKFLDMVLGR
jgi:inner membrane protein